LTMPNKGGKFSYSSDLVGHKSLQVRFEFKINQLRFLPEEYAVIKKFMDVIIEKQDEVIVLRKT